MKKFALLTIFCTLATCSLANDGWKKEITLFKKNSPNIPNYYRIPAITTTSNGNLIAVSDYREKGGHDIGLNGQKISFAVKISHDQGNTWKKTQLVIPKDNDLGITDPAIVHDSNSGKTFLFGFQNDKFITRKPVSKNSNFYVFTSNDNGNTWDSGKSIKTLLPKGYKYILQGPGSGTTYNGTIYMAIQAWHHEKDSLPTSTSGFIYSKDGGKTWKISKMLRTENYAPGTPNKPDVTSESNIFHHNGKIYLAAKAETRRTPKKRVVYSTSDNGNTWEKVEENFIPNDIAQCESSTLSLNDDVYIVGYTRDKYNDLSIPKNQQRRHGIYMTTNKGKTIEVFDKNSDGYTSITQDKDNLYILFEEKGNMLMRKYDISSKEYANINAQIVERGKELLNTQEKLFTKRTYLGGKYINDKKNKSEIETVLLNGNYKIGVFHKTTTENSKDVYRTLQYKTKETSLVLSQDNVITKNDNIFIGYQHTNLKYENESKNDINSFIIGYSLNHDIKNNYKYHLRLNGIYSNNKLQRNNLEGIGRTANFDSYSIGLRNEISDSFNFSNNLNLKVALGLDTTAFGHNEINEKGGLKTIDDKEWNNATIEKNTNFSNELYLNTGIDKNIKINEKFTLKLGANTEYKKELMNTNNWKDKYTVLDVTKKYERPVRNNKNGILSTSLSLGVDISYKLEATISYSIDTTGDKILTGKMIYKF